LKIQKETAHQALCDQQKPPESSFACKDRSIFEEVNVVSLKKKNTET